MLSFYAKAKIIMEKRTTTCTSRIIICLVTILLLGAPTAHGERLKAKIEFTPKTVVPLVTLRLSLKCTLVPANSSDEGVIDVQSVVGVSLKQRNADDDFETVASVSYSEPHDPKLWGHWDDNKTAIDAHLHNHSRLLEVIVSDPTVNHTGDMWCEIFVNVDEGVKTLFDQDTIGYQEPNNKIFLNELRRLKLENEDQQQEIASQIKKLHEAEENINDHKSEILDLKAKNVELTKQIKDNNEDIEELNTYKSTKVAFSAVRDNGQQSFYENVMYGKQLVFNKTLVNHGGGYDPSTGEFTCPVAGTYYFRYDFQVDSVRGRADSAVYLMLNGFPVTWSALRDADHNSYAKGVIGAGLVLQLKKGDQLKIWTAINSLFYWKHGDGTYGCVFNGYLIK